jgi:VWFA-related protein
MSADILAGARCSRRGFMLSAASLGITSVLARAQAPQEKDATFSSDVQVVNILATVRDKKGQIIRDLTKDDFSLLENGRFQNIRYFSRDTDLPLTIGLLVDTSMSQEKVLDAERGASYRFVDQVLRENKDHVFVMQFDLTVQTRQILTSSRKQLESSLPFVDTPTKKELRSQWGGGTLLYDSIVQASEDVMAKQKGRKALIVLSDGGENGSTATIAEAIEAAHRADVLIYTILYADSGYPSFGMDGKGIMNRLAKETGGGHFEVSKKMTIDQVYAVIEEDLRSQYSLGYVPATDPDVPASSGFRRIQLTVKRPAMVVQSRDRYWVEVPTR